MKHHLNSDLERACKKASDDTLIATADRIEDAKAYVIKEYHMTDAQFSLFAIAMTGIENHLMRHVHHRDLVRAEAEQRPKESDDEYHERITHIITSDDDHFEQHYFQAKRAYLTAQHERERQGRGELLLSVAEARSVDESITAWSEIEGEALARGIHAKMYRNQELRNQNFRPPTNDAMMEMLAQGYIGNIPGHQFQERLDICLRDVEIAAEVGEADLLWRERFYLDKLREHIPLNSIVVKDASK